MANDAQKQGSLKTWALWVAGAIIAVLVIALVVVLWPNGNKKNQAATESSSSTTSAPASGNAGSCDAGSSNSKAVMKDAPSDTEWITTASGWVGPKSDKAGPKTDQPLRECFQHSPAGALNASYWSAIQLNDQATARTYLQDMAVASPARDKALSQMDQDGPSGEIFDLRGYKFINYKDDQADLRLLVSAGSNGKKAEMSISLKWDDGQWKLIVPEGLDTSVRQVEDQSQFISWGP